MEILLLLNPFEFENQFLEILKWPVKVNYFTKKGDLIIDSYDGENIKILTIDEYEFSDNFWFFEQNKENLKNVKIVLVPKNFDVKELKELLIKDFIHRLSL